MRLRVRDRAKSRESRGETRACAAAVRFASPRARPQLSAGDLHVARERRRSGRGETADRRARVEPLESTRATAPHAWPSHVGLRAAPLGRGSRARALRGVEAI